MEYTRICANDKCKKTFVTKRPNKLTCCAECSAEITKVRNRKWAREQYLKRKIVKSKCKNCGKDYIKTRGKVYCSDECRAAWLERNKNKVKCCCEICGSDFMAEFKVIFCSETCKEIGRNLGMNVEATRRRRKKKRDILSEYALKARMAGMSYGNYVGQEYLEKLRSEGKY